MKLTKKIVWIVIFAIAMAFLEAAVVVYLRRLYGISDPILTVPPFDPQIARIELGRELATLLMLLSLGWIAGQKLQSRLGFTLVAFGVWVIVYSPVFCDLAYIKNAPVGASLCSRKSIFSHPYLHHPKSPTQAAHPKR